MNYRQKKILLYSGLTLGAIAITGACFGAYFGSSKVPSITEKKEFVLRSNTQLTDYGYKFDLSATYGAPTSDSQSVMLGANLIHLKTEDKLIENPDNNKVIIPSKQSYELSLAKGVILTFTNRLDINDKRYLYFDSDAVDPYSPDLNVNNNEIYIMNSSNPKSINNQDVFLKLIKIGGYNGEIAINNLDPTQIQSNLIAENSKWILTNLGFSVKDNAYWVDSNGNKTKYKIVPEDFWYSFMRTKLFDTNYRQLHGGSSKLDSYFILLANATSRFQPKDRFPNEYLFQFFDLDSTMLYDEKNAIKEIALDANNKDLKTKYLDFTAAKDLSGNIQQISGFISIFNKILTNNLTFSAAPSEFIKSQCAQPNNLNTNLGSEKLEISGLARQFGIYTYGQTREQTLYASPYIPTYSREGKEIFTYNPYFADSDWVNYVEKGITVKRNNKNVTKYGLKKIILQYSGGIDTSTFNSQVLNSYLQKTLSTIDYSILNNNQKQLIYGNSIKKEDINKTSWNNGLQMVKKLNISKLVQRTLVQSNPTSKKDENDTFNENYYLFNDNYSKLVFGLSRRELFDGNKTTGKNFFMDLGFRFRTLIQASINWDYYIKTVSNNTKIMWLSGAAQDARFSDILGSKTPWDYSGYNIDPSKINNSNNLTPEEKELLKNNSIYSVNSLPYLIGENLKYEIVTPLEMINHTNNNLNNAQISMQSPHFNKIKNEVKRIIDEFVQSGQYDSSQKISWYVVYPYADNNDYNIKIMKDVVETINSLDPRLEAILKVPKNREEMLAFINQNIGISNFNGWGYDYEGIGSYISAFSNQDGVTLVNAFSYYSLQPGDAAYDINVEKMQKLFPHFSELSKYVRTETKNFLSKININENLNDQSKNNLFVQNWFKVTNSQNLDSVTWFKQEQLKSNPNLPKEKLIDLSTMLAQIFKDFEINKMQDPKTGNTYFALLIQELNAIKGVSLNFDNSIVDPKKTTFVLNLKEYEIPVTRFGINYFQDYGVILD